MSGVPSAEDRGGSRRMIGEPGLLGCCHGRAPRRPPCCGRQADAGKPERRGLPRPAPPAWRRRAGTRNSCDGELGDRRVHAKTPCMNQRGAIASGRKGLRDRASSGARHHPRRGNSRASSVVVLSRHHSGAMRSGPSARAMRRRRGASGSGPAAHPAPRRSPRPARGRGKGGAGGRWERS